MTDLVTMLLTDYAYVFERLPVDVNGKERLTVIEKHQCPARKVKG
jgi:hypothetical protein